METILWGRKAGAAEWEEELITSTTDPEHLKRAEEWARANGFVTFRTAEFDGSEPDFQTSVRQ